MAQKIYSTGVLVLNRNFGKMTLSKTVRIHTIIDAAIHVVRPLICRPPAKIDAISKDKNVVARAIKLERLGAYFDVSFDTIGANIICASENINTLMKMPSPVI